MYRTRGELKWFLVVEMAIDREVAPREIRRFLDWLAAEGFVAVEQQSSGLTNQFARYEGAGRIVTVTSDRGEWSLSASDQTMEAGFHPDEWEAWLDGFDLAGELSPLDHQVDFLMSRWSCALTKARAHSGTEAEIREIGRDYVFRRFGFRE